jgi:hypothetical protein
MEQRGEREREREREESPPQGAQHEMMLSPPHREGRIKV